MYCAGLTDDFDPLISESLRSKDKEPLLRRFEHIADEQKTVPKIHGFKCAVFSILWCIRVMAIQNLEDVGHGKVSVPCMARILEKRRKTQAQYVLEKME